MPKPVTGEPVSAFVNRFLGTKEPKKPPQTYKAFREKAKRK